MAATLHFSRYPALQKGVSASLSAPTELHPGLFGLSSEIGYLLPHRMNLDAAELSESLSSRAAVALRIEALTFENGVRRDLIPPGLGCKQLTADACILVHLASQPLTVIVEWFRGHVPAAEFSFLFRSCQMSPWFSLARASPEYLEARQSQAWNTIAA